jgi:tape measure domain-containing protein
MTTVGTIDLIARIDTSQYKKGASEVSTANKSIEKSAEQTESNSNRSFSKISSVGIAGLVTAALAAGAAIIASIGGAVRRVDTLNNSERVFENMGFSSDAVRKSMDALESSITGLPTPLDAAVRGMTSLSATYGDVGKGQRIFTALNDAIIGFGGTAAEVDNAIQQLSQLPMDGPLDAQTWNSLRNSGLTPVLVAIAKDMGMGIDEMKDKFGSGQLTVEDFTNALVKMDTDGGGGMKSLQKIVRDSTSGVETSFDNMMTAITRGVGNIIESLGDENISNVITGIGKSFESVLTSISSVITFVKDNKDVIFSIAVGIGSVVAAMLAWSVATKAATVAQLAFNAVTTANPIGIVVVALAALTAGLVYFFTQTETGKKIFSDTFETIKNIVSGAWNFISSVFGNVGGWFKDRFNDAINNIKSVFSGLSGFFQGVWNGISNIFGKVGTIVGDAIGGAFRGVINSVIGRAASIINGFINAINGAIDVVNKIPGVKIGKIGNLPVPQLATGGIVSAPTLAMIGEGREPEAVIPLSKLDDMLGRGSNSSNSNVTISIDMKGIMSRSKSDERDIAKNLIARINEELRAKGQPIIGGGSI